MQTDYNEHPVDPERPDALLYLCRKNNFEYSIKFIIIINLLLTLT